MNSRGVFHRFSPDAGLRHTNRQLLHVLLVIRVLIGIA